MKKSLSLALSLIMILATFTAMPFTALADDPTGTTGDCTWTYNEAKATLTISGKGAMGDTSGFSAYKGTATALIIGDEVTTIPKNEFNAWGQLTSVSIGAAVKEIGDWAFDYTYKLTGFKVSSKNQYFTAVNGVLFNKAMTVLVRYPLGNTAKAYTVPSSVIRIGVSAFDSSPYLETVTIPNGVKKIDMYAFYECEKLKSASIPGSVKAISYEGFYGCESLETVTIANGIEIIGEEAFYDCYKLKSITIPDSVKSIQYEAIGYCNELKALTIPASAELAEEAIYCCEKLETVTFKNGTKEIPYYAVYECENLKKAVIPNSVTYIDSKAFYDPASEFAVVGFCGNTALQIYYDNTGNNWEKTHNYSISRVITPATLTSEGSKYSICSECGEAEYKVLPKLKANTLTAKGKTAKVKYAKLKKKAVRVKAAKAVTVKNAQGAVSYKIAKKNKKFTVAKNGNIKVKKGTKKGTYKIKIKVTAAGNEGYAPSTKTVTVKIKVG